MAAAADKAIDYAWLCGIYRRGVNVKLGATGNFPYWKLDRDDQGEIAVAIAADPRHGVVRFEFGKLISSLALPAKFARELAAVLVAKADEIDRRTI